MTKVTCELRALEPVPGSADADGGPAGAARTKCRGLSASEANAGAVLIEERAATLTQFLNFLSLPLSLEIFISLFEYDQ